MRTIIVETLESISSYLKLDVDCELNKKQIEDYLDEKLGVFGWINWEFEIDHL